MSLEPNLAALVAASTKLTKSITMPLSVVNGKRDAATTAQADITAAETAIAAASATATTDAATTASKLSAAAADYAAQKTTKGLAAVQTSADTELKDRLHRRDPARHPFRGARPSLVMDFVRRECHRNNAAGNLEPVDLSTFMTFTRGSTATYVGPDGLIKEAASNVPRYGYDPVTGEALWLLVEEQRTNLLKYSEQFYIADWSKYTTTITPNIVISPDGKMSADKMCEGTTGNTTHYVQQTNSVTAGVLYTYSIYMRAAERTWGGIEVYIGDKHSCGARFNLINGSVSGLWGGTESYLSENATAKMEDVGGGWYRCSITLKPASTAIVNPYTYSLLDAWTIAYAGTVGYGIYIWGAQLEAGAFPTSYIPTPATFTGRASTKTYFDSNGVLQTAASGVAVTDYGYVDGRWVSKGLSLEGRATNVVTYSSGSNTTAYDGDSTTSVNAAAVGGIGLSTFVSTSGFSRRIGWFGISLGKGNVVASLFVAKQTGSVTLGFTPWEGSTSGATAVALDMGTGVGVLTKGSHTTASLRVEDCGSLWRVSVALTYLSGNYTLGMFYFTSTLTSLTLGGLQAETGPVATSYIPTTTAQVTRAADTSTSAQVTRAKDFATAADTYWFNNDSGTFAAFAKGGLESNQGGYGRVIGGGNSACVLGRDPSGGMQSWDGATDIKNATGGLLDQSFIKGAVAYSKNYRAISCNGASKVSGTFASFNIKGAGIGIGCYRESGNNSLNGYIKHITYFPRQLSDADLQALTILED